MQTMSNRSKQIWLVLMAVAVALFVMADVQLLAGLVVLVVLGIAMLEMAQSALQQRHRRQRLAVPTNMSQAAQHAQGQAMHHPNYSGAYGLVDIGLLLDEYRRDGLYIRRVRSISKADRALRPYVVVRSPLKGYAVPTLLRFEIMDAQDHPQYIYETEHPLKTGENAIVPNYRLPLKNNNKLGAAGQWMLNVWIDGGLVGSHTFMMYGAAHAAGAADGEVKATQTAEDPLPVSLEEVLAQQNSATKL